MTRAELTALGLTDEQVNGVMENYGKSIKQLQDTVVQTQADAEAQKAELKKYQKGGENYVDKTEIERLKNFETETLGREATAKKTGALTKLFKSANANDSITKLLIQGQNLDKIELDDKGEIKNGGELLKQAKADFADLFAGDGNNGAPQGVGSQTGAGAVKDPKKTTY